MQPDSTSNSNNNSKSRGGPRRNRRGTGRGGRGRGRGRGSARPGAASNNNANNGGGGASSSNKNGTNANRNNANATNPNGSNAKAANSNRNNANSARVSKLFATSSPCTIVPDGANTAASMCSICAEVPVDWAVGPCMHPICGDCSHRMRVLYKREACVYCNTLLTEVTVVPVGLFDSEASYADMKMLAKTFDKGVGMRFVDESRQFQLTQVRNWKCSSCDHVGSNAKALKKHVRETHSSQFCNLCFAGSASFVSELPVFRCGAHGGRSAKLRTHIEKNHPLCQFCNENFFDSDALYAHLTSKHETCQICDRNRSGGNHDYFRNFEELEKHYHAEHFPCLHPSCRAVVFATKEELQAHNIRNHGAGGSRRAMVKVDLAALPGPAIPSEQDERVERNRQAARRRAFDASRVAFNNANGNSTARANGTTRGASSSERPINSTSQAGPSRNPPSQPVVSHRIPPARTASTVPPAPIVPANSSSTAAVSRSGPASGSIYVAQALPQSRGEADARYAELMRTIRNVLDPSAFEQFKEASTAFEEDNIDAQVYYNATVDVFGVRQAIRDIFPELIALLTDGRKRNELTAAINGRHTTDSIAPQSTIEFPSLAGQRRVAPSLTPMVRTAYMPVPQSGDFPSLGGASGNRRGNRNGNMMQAQAMPQINMNRVFGGGAQPPPPTNLPIPRRSRRNLTDAFGPFPALGGGTTTSAPRQTLLPPATPLRSVNGIRGTQTQTITQTPLHMRPPTQSALRTTRAPPAPPAPPPAATFPTLPTAGNRSLQLQTPAPSFPSLSVISAAMLDSERSQRAQETPAPIATSSSGDADNIPDPDVTNRVGAVWGGLSSAPSSSSGSRRKRGPGGRTPAAPPEAVFGSKSTGLTTKHGSMTNLTQEIRDKEVENRVKLSQSALPKVGAGGYGFSWERKNNNKKKKQIRNQFKDSNNNNNKDGAGPSSSGGNNNNNNSMLS